LVRWLQITDQDLSFYRGRLSIMILPEEIEAIAFLRNLGEPYANQVARLAQLRECPAGAVLFREGGACTHIYFVLQGTVELEIESTVDRSVWVQTVGAGDLLGWSSLLTGGPMTATAQARERCRLASLAVAPLLALCNELPRFGAAFMRQMAIALAERLQTTRRLLTSEYRSAGDRSWRPPRREILRGSSCLCSSGEAD
jgi:CRP-like cAMP-binding protein